MPRGSTIRSWADRPYDEYENSYTNYGDRPSIQDQRSNDERRRRELERRGEVLEEEFQQLRSLHAEAVANESVKDEYNRLQPLRHAYHESQPRSTGRPYRYGGRDPDNSDGGDYIGPAAGPVFVEAHRPSSYIDASQRYNRGRPAQSTFDADLGIRDILLAPFTGESKQSYLERMYRGRESMSAAEARWQDMEGRWQPFVAETKRDYIDRIDLCGLQDKPTRTESGERWEALEGRFAPLFGEEYGEYLLWIDDLKLGDERPSLEDTRARWRAAEGMR